MTESTALTPMQTFQERLKGKLRDDIASMLPDEAISEMVKTVINEEFFTKRTVKKASSNHYNPEYETAPSEFQEMVLKSAKPIIEEQVRRVLVENARVIQESLDNTIRGGVLKMMLEVFDAKITDVIQKKGWEIKNALEQLR